MWEILSTSRANRREDNTGPTLKKLRWKNILRVTRDVNKNIVSTDTKHISQ